MQSGHDPRNDRSRSPEYASFTGVDILVDESTNTGVLLELNSRPGIRTASFPNLGPSAGNKLAEALIDYYFPESVNNHRLPLANFDFTAVCRVLGSHTVGSITLPTVQPDWKHKRFQIECGDQDQTSLLEQARILVRHYGLYGPVFCLDEKHLAIDVCGPPNRVEAITQHILGQRQK